MKKIFLFLAVGVMLFAACKPREEGLQCNVDPDSVFGQHYVAWDFQIWYALNENDMAYNDLLSMMNIDSNVTVLGYGLKVPYSDKAAVMAEALKAVVNYIDNDTNSYMPVWQDDVDSTSTLFFAYGFEAPDMTLPVLDGTEVEKAKTYYGPSGAIEVAMVFNKDAAERWAQITRENLGRNVVVMLGADREGRVLTAPRIMGEITGGRCSVVGLTVDEACALAKILNNK